MQTLHMPCVGSIPAALPIAAGIGFKPQHFDALMGDATPPAFVEVHAENYFGAGGLPHAQLAALRERVALSVHGVGLSIGGEDALDAQHLARIATLLQRHPVAMFSEHLAWSSHGGVFFNDLLPVCYDDAALLRVCNHIDAVQNALGRRILLENPSTYVEYAAATMPEAAFIAEVVRTTGCGLLLDINNVYVSCTNHRQSTMDYLALLPLHAVGEIHLAGYTASDEEGPPLLIDTHGAPVADAVWELYEQVLLSIGPCPTLIEWDTDVPAYAVLRAEAARAQELLDRCMKDADERAAA